MLAFHGNIIVKSTLWL